MDLSLTPEQAMLVESARGMLATRTSLAATRAQEAAGTLDRTLWKEMARLGWFGLDADERFVDAVLLVEELGRALLVSPFIPAVVMAGPWLARTTHGARVAAGELVATMAVAGPGSLSVWDSPTARFSRGRLRGFAMYVPFAADADVVLVAVAGGGVVLVERGAFTCLPGLTVGGDPLSDLAFDDAAAELVAPAMAVTAALDRGAVATMAYLVGAAERVLAMTLEHAKTREQFDRPIGSFQAVAHRCVEMRSDIDALRVLVHQAAWTVATGGAGDVAIGSALAYGLAALRRIVRHAHQVHGAIGFSTEHDLQLFTRRMKAAELLWGPPARHHERVARGMGL